MRGLRTFLTGIMVGLTMAAIDRELQQPPAQRQWRGKIAGVPYNFRVWDWRYLLSQYWNPQSDEIFTDKAIGVGWGVNFAALSRRAQEWLSPDTARTTLPVTQTERV